MNEARAAGKLLNERGFTSFDRAFTSRLQRANVTCDLCLSMCAPNTIVTRAWQLNERHYGALQGRAKNDPHLIGRYGVEQMTAWRREFYARPPPMDEIHPYFEGPPAPLTGTCSFYNHSTGGEA